MHFYKVSAKINLSCNIGDINYEKNGFQLQDFTVDNILDLMNIYWAEWCARNETLWNQVFKYFYATLIVLFLPNISTFIGIALPVVPSVLFPAVALIMSLVFLYVSLGFAKRLEAIAKTYQNLINLLPPELRRIPMSSPEISMGKFYNKPLSYITSYLMFIALSVMSLVMIVYNILQ